MPHTGNAIIIYLVAQSSFLQTGWHNILSIPMKTERIKAEVLGGTQLYRNAWMIDSI
ncbi:MAG: hypothetical protein ACTTI6_07115 [Treponema sp.]